MERTPEKQFQETNGKIWWKLNVNTGKEQKKENTECSLWDDLQEPHGQLHHTITWLHIAKLGHQKNGVTRNRSRVAGMVVKQRGKYSSVFDTMDKIKYLSEDVLLIAPNTGWKHRPKPELERWIFQSTTQGRLTEGMDEMRWPGELSEEVSRRPGSEEHSEKEKQKKQDRWSEKQTHRRTRGVLL